MINTQTRAGARALAAPRRRNLAGAGLTALTYVIAILFFFPVLWTVLTSFKTEGTAVAQPPTLIFQPTLENYHTALVSTSYFGFFVNSVILSLGSTLLAFLL